MSYPVLEAKRADEVAQALRDGDDPDVGEYVDWRDGPTVNLDELRLASDRGRDEWDTYVARLESSPSNADRWRLDAMLAPIIHDALRRLPPQVLDDRGFWRYLALFPFRWLLIERRTDATKFQRPDYGGSKQTVRGFLENHFVLKCYRRGAISRDDSADDPYERATRITRFGESDVDVWDSHFHKSKLGAVGDASRAIFDSITKPTYFGREPTRQLAKLLARDRHNLLFDYYDYDRALELSIGKRVEASAMEHRDSM